MPVSISSAAYGLSETEVEKSRKIYGSNQLRRVGGKSFFSRYLESFADPMIRILLVALGINVIFLFKSLDWYEPIGIALSIFIATTISTISEHGSQSAFERLVSEAAKISCRVMRGGVIREIPAQDVVVGDYVLLQSGDMIPADGCMLSGRIEVNQASLNGESKEVQKFPKDIPCSVNDLNAQNAVFRGCTVCGGEGAFIVNKVGDSTFYGNMAKEVQAKTRESPMKIRLQKLAATISKIGYTGAVLVGVSYIFRILSAEFNFNLQLFANYYGNLNKLLPELLNIIMLSVTVIVVSVPEGLPMMITVVLSANMKKMLSDNVLVRKMVGIETAGNIDMLFCDKTGTLTDGRLSVCCAIDGNCNIFYNTDSIKKHNKYWNIFYNSTYYNNAASFSYSGNKREITGGNATDKALLEFIKSDTPLDGKRLDIIKKIPFDSNKKYSAVLTDDKAMPFLIKGATEIILSKCKYYYNGKGQKVPLESTYKLKEMSDSMAADSVRLLAVACSEKCEEEQASDLTLVCIIGIKDHLRKESKQSVTSLNRAGIQVVMVTGDNRITAKAIAFECGILCSKYDWITDSAELSKMTDREIEKKLPALKVVARALPSDKSRLVRICQNCGHVAGMTGDGVNDAPALKAADVGFSMGSGSEVAKEASDIVILDDNIYSITKAVLYGRTIFKSIRKFLIYQLTVNMCAVGLSVLAPLLGVKNPVTIMQMLWINLVMDTLGGLAFSGEPVRESYMREKPKPREENILNKYMISQVLWTGVYSLVLCLLFLKLPLLSGYLRPSGEYIMTALFALFMFMAIFNSLNARTHNINLCSYLSGNKPFVLIMSVVFIVQSLMIYIGGSVFRTADLTATEFIITLVLALSVIPADIARKLILKKMGRLKGV